MDAFVEVPVKDFSINPFIAIGKEWMLITAAKADGTANTMTAAWGGLGWLWERPVAFIFVRQTRYTKEFIDESGKVSLSFLGMGVVPPDPSWGIMIQDGQTYLATEPWLMLMPGIAILTTVLAFTLLGDGLRDALDVKMKDA